MKDIGLDSEDVAMTPMIYNVTELSTAVKQWLLRQLLERTEWPVVYFHPDIEIFTPLYEIEDLASRHGIVITPHITDPIPQDSALFSCTITTD